jgi:hypothetical protein
VSQQNGAEGARVRSSVVDIGTNTGSGKVYDKSDKKAEQKQSNGAGSQSGRLIQLLRSGSGTLDQQRALTLLRWVIDFSNLFQLEYVHMTYHTSPLVASFASRFASSHVVPNRILTSAHSLTRTPYNHHAF